MIKSGDFMKQELFFMCLQYMSFENTVEKEEIARNEQYLLFPHCFLPVTENFSANFIKFEIVVCKLFQFEIVQNLSFGKGLNNTDNFAF